VIISNQSALACKQRLLVLRQSQLVCSTCFTSLLTFNNISLVSYGPGFGRFFSLRLLFVFGYSYNSECYFNFDI